VMVFPILSGLTFIKVKFFDFKIIRSLLLIRKGEEHKMKTAINPFLSSFLFIIQNSFS